MSRHLPGWGIYYIILILTRRLIVLAYNRYSQNYLGRGSRLDVVDPQGIEGQIG